MGSFNYTCALSELPIAPGDDVYLVALAPSSQGLNGGACSEFDLVFPPLRGVYDDYGFADDLRPTLFHEAFAIKMGYANAGAFAEQLKEGDVVVKSFSGNVAARFCLVKLEAWNAMLDMPCPWGGNGSSCAADLLVPGAREGARIFAKAPDIMSKIDLSSIQKRMELGEYDQDRLAQMLMNTYLLEGVDEHGPFSSMFAQRMLRGHSSSELFSGASTLALLALDMPTLGSTESDIEDALVLYGQTMMVNSAMNSVRKIWLARDSSGPQFGESALHWLWARKLGAMADKAIDWDGDENDYLSGFAQAKALRERDAISQQLHAPSAKAKPAKL
jgi:hypothetical protein